MQKTRGFNQIQQKFTPDKYLHKLVGVDVDVDEQDLLRHAVLLVWDLPSQGTMPNSLDVALMLSELGSDETTLIVTLLSNRQLFQQKNTRELERIFGKKIMALVDSVMQLHAFHGKHDESSPEQVERIRRMLMSMVNDVRAVLIKLAFRVQRLRQLKLAPAIEQKEIATESLAIFAPIANRLGIGKLKWQIEDLSFRYLNPKTYQQIAQNIAEKREEREQFILDVVEKIKALVAQENINAIIFGRPKHIYSIWKKMTKKQRSFDELFDVRAVRIVVNSIAECYVVLGLIHAQWRHISKEFDDYIANPKENGYQSLHTAVYGPKTKPVEIQIRTRQMDEFSEFGVAAHWRYKEDGNSKKYFHSGIESLRKLLDPTQVKDDELLESFRSEMFNDRVFVLTPGGRVIDLPEGATPIDFAYAVHTEIGHRCRGAKVNGRIVQLTYALKNAQCVQILTGKEASPRRDWMISHLSFIKTARAKNRIRSWFRKQDEEKNYLEGKAIAEREFKRLGVKVDTDKLVKHFKLNLLQDLYINLGRGDISISQLTALLNERSIESLDKDITASHETATNKAQKKSSTNINVLGVGNLLTSIAQCCMPIPDDQIIGFITKDRGVSVHRIDCKNILHLQEKEQVRLIEVEWGESPTNSYSVTIVIDANDRHGLLGDVSTTLVAEKVNVTSVNTASNKNQQTARMVVTLDIKNIQQLSRIMDKISQLRNIIEVRRGSTAEISN